MQALAKMPAETEPIVKPSLKLTHFWLYVKDTHRSIQFYRDILGFDTVQTFPDGAFATLLRSGVKFLTEVQKQTYGQIASFNDPDGYLLELWQP